MTYHRQSLDVIQILDECGEFIEGRMIQAESDGIRKQAQKLIERINQILGRDQDELHF